MKPYNTRQCTRISRSLSLSLSLTLPLNTPTLAPTHGLLLPLHVMIGEKRMWENKQVSRLLWPWQKVFLSSMLAIAECQKAVICVKDLPGNHQLSEHSDILDEICKTGIGFHEILTHGCMRLMLPTKPSQYPDLQMPHVHPFHPNRCSLPHWYEPNSSKQNNDWLPCVAKAA